VNTATCEAGHAFGRTEGFLDLRFPKEPLPSDAEFQAKYDAGANVYDAGLDWLFRSFYEDEAAVRSTMAEALELDSGDLVLEIGAGTGKDSFEIARRLGENGKLVATELSAGMLERAKQRLSAASAPVDFLLANAAYLPFADRSFDAVFHFGGINEFGDKGRAIAEMTRVAKIGAKVVVGDEGLPPWLRGTAFGATLVNANPLYRHEPPLALLPESARDVRIRWLLGNAFYLIEYRIGDGPPPLDVDLPIPGKGDSLRLRLERAKEPPK
jgi:ubiquinone/menaquinone biosynthesis C-methylase UbiE